jgi:FecR protein
MSFRTRSLLQLWTFMVCLLLTNAAFAQAAGKVLLAVGDVAALRGSARVALTAGAAVNVGDTVVTGAQSHAQLRFADDALVALKPDSEFRIERYNFTGASDGGEVAVFRLVKGGFRTLTGQIGKLNRDQYQLLTTQATIGIRGTHYQVQICSSGQCTNGGEPARSGMYGGVYEGRVAVSNALGADEYGAEEFFYVPDGEAPQRWLAPPDFLSDQLDDGRRLAAAQAPTQLRFAKVPDIEVPLALGAPKSTFTYTATEDLTAPNLVGVDKTIVIGSDRYTLELDSTANPNLQLDIGNGGQLASFNNGRLSAGVGTASIVDVGSDGTGTGLASGSGLNWGRWQGAGSTIAQTLGSQVVHNDGGNLHYIYGNVATSMPASGQVSYAAIGGTHPTDSGTGAVGTLISGGTINVNFTTAQLALTGLAVGFGSATYTMAGSTSILNGQFSTAPVGATAGCTGGGCQSLIAGNFTGFFAGPGGAGIGLDYYFNTRTGSVIEGVAGYRKCVSGKC